ncbi:MAG: DUF2156 domain-containing protein [Spirochaetes bacterium]|nr:DUF2156 domain-containing protein [Spirochaetota bacterium]MBN2770733.1 DUF2156 domain-containing protein [Spirochaetota bacterium]
MGTLHIGEYELMPFDISAKAVMDKYLAQLDLDTSDYTFAANYLWLSNGTGFYSIINETFCFFLLTSGELSMLLPPVGKKANVIDAMLVCFQLMDDNNSSPFYSKIEYVDEILVSDFINNLEDGAEIFDMLEEYIIERKLVDYLYDANDLIELRGGSYSSKRNEINKFMRINPDHVLDTLDVEKHGAGILNLVNKWIADRMKYMPREEADAFLDGIYSERIAVKRMLKDYKALDLTGLVITINGEIKGFTVGEKVNSNTASVIIEKTDFEIFGCAQYIFREFVRILANDYNVTSINVGDDMGFENLKKVKLSYRPSKLLPKYTIYKRY